ncbi:c-type cytochrome [Aquibaculum arenosum]|uniref:Cytochrome c family protein n=1 Tax=Aquibaculum arenosum TaxID=3032591 RepID=A0ABT5YK00_9PROT|nr:cytochrome c family protein [Fodinicurvata sp. CAU 1616]MDF2095263.1 cytochrome c family protein [Fodinicurvata sp. CAU 1616]
MSLELNKMAAAVLTAGVVAMSTGFIAKLLVHPASLEENAYPIEVSDAGGAAPAEAEEPGLEPVLPLLADADVEAGEGAFRACAACHTVDEGGAHRVGPNLWDIVGASHAHADGFNYSDAMASLSDEPWTYEALNAFIENPRETIPGTRMSYGGMRSVEDRANLIAYLRSLSNDPAPLPTEEEIQEVVGEEEAEPAEAEGEGQAEAEGEEQAASEEDGSEAATEEAAGEEAAPEEAEGEEAAAGSEEAGAEDTAAEGDSELAAAIGDADPADGESLFRRCASCHTADEGGPNRVGPNLWDIVGASVAHLDSFNYSDAAREMGAEGVTWTYENLDAFLEAPRDWMPGTRMVFPGLRDAADRAAMIAFLRSKSDDPAPLE